MIREKVLFSIIRNTPSKDYQQLSTGEHQGINQLTKVPITLLVILGQYGLTTMCSILVCTSLLDENEWITFKLIPRMDLS